ncbi:hypothetical protein CABS03_05555 [Colletotrichum abscissum]
MRRPSSTDFEGEGGLAPTNSGGSNDVENLLSSGELARSAFNVTGGPSIGDFGVSVKSSVASSTRLSPVDFRLLALCSSSSSSAISINRLRLKELVEDEVDPDAACKEQAADSLVSLSSFAEAIEKSVLYGANRSHTALKWTVTRATIDRQKAQSASSPSGMGERPQ